MTQTVRYFTASLGLAVLGSLLISETKSDATAALTHQGLPKATVARIVASIDSGPGVRPHSGAASAVFATIQHDFARSTRIVYLALAGVMALSFLIAVRRMERGLPQEVAEAPDAAAAHEPGM